MCVCAHCVSVYVVISTRISSLGIRPLVSLHILSPLTPNQYEKGRERERGRITTLLGYEVLFVLEKRKWMHFSVLHPQKQKSSFWEPISHYSVINEEGFLLEWCMGFSNVSFFLKGCPFLFYPRLTFLFTLTPLE